MKRFPVLIYACVAALGAAPADPNAPPGVPNFHRVNDHIYRGAQPANRGFGELAKFGIRTIVDLREPGDRSMTEEKLVETAGMRYLSFPMAGYHAPSSEMIANLLPLLDDAAMDPVFVHCRRGADRTGTVLACYRIAHDHWENARALAEAKSLGMSWTEWAMQSYIMHYKPLGISAPNQ